MKKKKKHRNVNVEEYTKSAIETENKTHNELFWTEKWREKKIIYIIESKNEMG